MKRSSRLRWAADVSESVHQQLDMYAIAAGAAGVSVLALCQPAEAKIVYTHAHRTIPSGGHYQLDLNHDGVPDFVLANTFRSLNSSFSGTSSALVYPFKNGSNRVYGHGHFASCLHQGVRVGPGGHFSAFDRIMAQMHWFDGSYSVLGDWANGGTGAERRFLGFRFKINGETHYGWARLNVVISDSYPGLTTILTGYAYETIPGKAIKAGQTGDVPDDATDARDSANPDDPGPGASLTSPIPDKPQPASLGALAMGAPGLSTWRQKENASMLAGGYHP